MLRLEKHRLSLVSFIDDFTRNQNQTTFVLLYFFTQSGLAVVTQDIVLMVSLDYLAN